VHIRQPERGTTSPTTIAREVSADESALWSEAFPWLAEVFEAVAPVVIAFAGRQPAAICHSPRGHTAYAAEAGVVTLELYGEDWHVT